MLFAAWSAGAPVVLGGDLNTRHPVAPGFELRHVHTGDDSIVENAIVTRSGDERLVEWDYGDYEGLTTPEIRTTRPGWTIWNDVVPGGETIDQVGARADAAIVGNRSRGLLCGAISRRKR